MPQNCITSGVHGYIHSITRIQIQIQKMITDIHTTVTTWTVTIMTMGTLTTTIISTDIHTMILTQTQTYPGLHLMKMIGPLTDTLTAITHTQQTVTIMTTGTRMITIISMDIYTWTEITFATDKR